MSQTIPELIEVWPGYAVICRYHSATGAWVFIALHDNTMGSPAGGTRIMSYPTPAAGLRDAMRLAAGMTAKWAVLEINKGGGKAVLAVPRPIGGQARVDLLHRYGDLLESLSGSFSTGVDLGTTPEDMAIIAERTEYVHGVNREDGTTVDPCPFTALGVLSGTRAAARSAFGSDDLSGRQIVLQGIGGVGAMLADHLVNAGAHLIVCDTDSKKARSFARLHGSEIVEPESVYDIPCDIFAPCAVGAVLNQQTIPRLACRIVAGAANNQLQDEEDAAALHRRGILYAPDYVINAGGALAFALMGDGIRKQHTLNRHVNKIGDSLDEIFRESTTNDESPVAAARRRVDRVLQQKQSK